MQILNKLEILTKPKEIELCWIPSHIGIKGNDQTESTAKTAWKIPRDKSFKIPYTDLKNKNKKSLPKTNGNNPHNKLQNIKAEIGEWKEGYRKSRREEIILSDITHRHHSLISTQIRTTTMVCVMLRYISSKTPIDRLHRPNTKKTIYLHCKKYKKLFKHVVVDKILAFLKAVDLCKTI